MAAAQTFLTGNGDERRALVVVFLRGGADGLSLVPPIGDAGYHRARPRIAIKPADAVKLDGFFGLNPLLRDLEPAWKEGALALIHAVGSEDATRSHFEAQDLMEHGGLAGGGWLGRFLRHRKGASHGPLSAIALGRSLPECLRGAPAATAMTSLKDFSLGAPAKFLDQLGRLYGATPTALGPAGRDTLAALRRIEQLHAADYKPANGAEYAGDYFSQGLRQVAQLIKARVGLEAASVDLNGWDSHLSQESVMNPEVTKLNKGLAAFHRDLGPLMATTTVVVMTEFGRRVEENSAFGTDHGRASAMLVLGGGVQGGRVLGAWPGLTRDILEGPGDLPVTTNYRNVLAPILVRHGAADLAQVFPDFNLAPLDLHG
jgi:uncharacterized protein (DUF1501 family)